MNREDYDKKNFKIIEDPKKFKPVDKHPTLQREAKLKRTLRKLRKNGHLSNDLSDDEHRKIYHKGSLPARIYGPPKMHKVRIYLHIIISPSKIF